VAQVRYWAAARELAGTATEPVDGSTVAAVLEAVGARHGPGMAALLSRSVLLLDGSQASPADAVGAAALLEVLPPYAGGSA
jgi:molybdopterin synthase sulfur carrier subunit